MGGSIYGLIQVTVPDFCLEGPRKIILRACNINLSVCFSHCLGNILMASCLPIYTTKQSLEKGLRITAFTRYAESLLT